MTHLQFEMILAIAAATVIGTTQGLAQTPIDFDNCSDIRSVLFSRGDVLSIACDTVYVLNTLTFRRYDAAYKDLRKKGPSIANLMSAYDEIIALQEQRLAVQQKSFDELRMNFNDLAGTTSTTIEGSAARLSLAVASVDSLKSEMTETRRLLGETQEILESEKRGLNLEKLLWGAGGLAAGLVLGVVISN